MSTRFYPRFVKGNPQLRIFLPDWKLIMIKPKQPMPENIVSFKTDPRMTDWDIKNYLESIYKVQVAGISSRIYGGELRKTSVGPTKKDDYKISHVTLPMGQTFRWPDLFPQEKLDEKLSDYEKTLKEINVGRKEDPDRFGLPSWLT